MADPTAPQNTPLFGVPMGGVAPAAAPPPAAQPVAAPAQPQHYVEQDGKHRGVAGVARDILGTLGDFLLTRLHMPAMYGPAQHQRRLAAAQDGIDTDPVGAIQRVSSVDPVFGARLRDQYIDNQRLAAAQESTAEARSARLQAAQTVLNDRTRSRAAAMLGTMTAWDDPRRTTNYGALRDQVIRYGQAQGLDLSSELPTEFDANQLDSFIEGAVPVDTQRAQRLTRERMEQQGQQFQQRDETTRRGQDISSADRQSGQAITARGQDISSADRQSGQAITARGQDISSADRRSGQAVTARGQDISSADRRAGQADTRRGQDIRSADTRRGQDIGSADRRSGQAVTARGQDIRSADTRRGQDISSADRRAAGAERGRHNRVMETRPGRFTPDPNRIYVQNGRRFRYNAQTRTYDPVN